MHKNIIFLSGTPEQRAELMIPLVDKLSQDVNHVYADILNIEDYARSEMKAAYSDLKKAFKLSLRTSRSWIVINIPADVKSAWQTYADIAMLDPNMSFTFYGLASDNIERKINHGRFRYESYLSIDKNKCEEILNCIC